jgi:hypothetical protein
MTIILDVRGSANDPTSGGPDSTSTINPIYGNQTLLWWITKDLKITSPLIVPDVGLVILR